MEFLALLASPIAGAACLALFGARRWAPEANAAFSFATLIAAAALTVRVIGEGNITAAAEQFFIDPFNVFLVSLTAFVSFTTSLFSRPYMRIEREHGRVNAGQLRLYHSMYQLFIAAMLIALTSNNMGLVWVAMEAATLSTVLLVTLYRTPASLEAGWKYFILCGVGIAQALFGTILLYFAAEKVLGGEGMTALLWTHLNSVKDQLEPAVLSLAFVFSGIWFVRSGRAASKAGKGAVAIVVISFVATTATFVFANAGPPSEARSITGKMFAPAVHMYGFGWGKVKLEVSDDDKSSVRLIVPNPPKTAGTPNEEE